MKQVNNFKLQVSSLLEGLTNIRLRIFFVFISFFVFYIQPFAQNIKENSICLEVVGIALADKNQLDGVSVTLYQENEEMEMDEITCVAYHEHSFMFKLMRDSYYTIEISKEGYVSRMIAISTKLPKGVKADPVFRYEFEVELFKEKKELNDYYLDFPVALIDYDTKREAFVSHGKYTKHIKNKINSAMKQTSTN